MTDTNGMPYDSIQVQGHIGLKVSKSGWFLCLSPPMVCM